MLIEGASPEAVAATGGRGRLGAAGERRGAGGARTPSPALWRRGWATASSRRGSATARPARSSPTPARRDAARSSTAAIGDGVAAIGPEIGRGGSRPELRAGKARPRGRRRRRARARPDRRRRAPSRADPPPRSRLARRAGGCAARTSARRDRAVAGTPAGDAQGMDRPPGPPDRGRSRRPRPPPDRALPPAPPARAPRRHRRPGLSLRAGARAPGARGGQPVVPSVTARSSNGARTPI